MKRTYFENLDGLRTIAFLMVFISHCWKNLYFKFESEWLNVAFSKVFDIGSLGVNLFFVLSGFLITYLLFEEKEQNGAIHIRNFYIRRILRIWPVYFLVVIVFVFMLPYFIGALKNEYADINPINIFRYLFFLVNFDHIAYGINFRLASVLWSVSVEEQFYLFWPIVLTVFSKKNWLFVFISLVLGSYLFRFLNYQSYRIFNYHTLSVIGDLSIGAIGAYIGFYHKKALSQFIAIKHFKLFVIYIIGISILIFRNDIFTNQFTVPLMGLFGSLFFCFIILEQNYNAGSHFKMKNSIRFSNFGKYTYGLYCYHFIAIFSVNYFRNYFHLDPKNLLLFVVFSIISLLISFAMAYMSYTYMEKPLLRMKTKFI